MAVLSSDGHQTLVISHLSVISFCIGLHIKHKIETLQSLGKLRRRSNHKTKPNPSRFRNKDKIICFYKRLHEIGGGKKQPSSTHVVAIQLIAHISKRQASQRYSPTHAPAIQLCYIWGFRVSLHFSRVRLSVPNTCVSAEKSELQETHHTAAQLINSILFEATSNFSN